MSIVTDANPMTFVLTADRERVRHFYADVLGLSLVSEDLFALMFRLGNGTLLRVTGMASHAPLPSTVLGWVVPDIRAAMAELVEKGVTFSRYEGFEQDENGLWASPDGKAWVAWFPDPDGNMLSLTQF